MRTTVHLPDDLLRRAKRKAAEEGRTLTSLIEEGLRLALAGPAGGGRPRTKSRLSVPISRHAGGLLTGLDLTRGSDLQERDDLDYAGRMRRGFT